MADKSAEKILVIEDADSLREGLQQVLESEGYQVETFVSAEEAAPRLEQGDFSLILSDFRLPGMSGIDLLRIARTNSATVPFLVMTAYGTIEVAVEAMKQGANDFICKPFEPEDLCSTVREVIKHRQVVDRSATKRRGQQADFISQNPVVLSVMQEAKRAAKFDLPVLILGESGVGKEVLARYIHENSSRAGEQFLSVNCAAMPAELLESEFFGHEAGSFTGATQGRMGLLEVGSSGTVFLDEIGDMSAQLQVKLLRALQEGEIKRVGGNKNIKVNPRIIAATNRELLAAIHDGYLREDFYYRLAVIELTLPPLRERKEDIPLLAKHFMESFATRMGRRPVLSETSIDFLCAYHWPGNIRELENIIERAVVSGVEKIEPQDLGIEVDLLRSCKLNGLSTLPEVAAQATREAEVDMIVRALSQTHGNKSQAALMLGVSYKTLLNKIKEYQIDSSCGAS